MSDQKPAIPREVKVRPVPSAVVAGHICLDIIPAMPAADSSILIQPGHLIQVGAAVISTGGPVSNTGLALHKLGIPTRLAAKIGEDALGTTVRAVLQRFGPDLASGLVTDAQAGTSYSVIISPPGVDRTFWHYPGANDTFCADDIPYGPVADAALFHFGYPPLMRRMYSEGGAGLLEVFRRAKATGVTTSLDLCVPDPNTEAGRADWRSIYRAVLPYVDIFLPSVDELLFTLRRADFERLSSEGKLRDNARPELLSDISKELLDLGVRIVVIKLGEQGLYLRTADARIIAAMGRAAPVNPSGWSGRSLWAPCFRVEVVGTTGSGDAAIAGFLSALLRGLEPAHAMTAAAAVGACNVEAADALSGIRSWEETMARVAAGWPRRPIGFAPGGWRWLEAMQIWVGPDAGL